MARATLETVSDTCEGGEVTAQLQWQAAPCLYEMYRERLAALGAPQPAPPPPPQVAEDRFMHPVCLVLAESERPIPLKACNRGHRHIPVTAEPDGTYSAEWPNEDFDYYRLIGTLSDGREIAVKWHFRSAPAARSGNVVLVSRTPDRARDQIMIRAEDLCPRCYGDVDDARLIAPGILHVDYRAASYEFMKMVDDARAEETYSGLETCGIPCEIGTVTFEHDLAMNQQRLVSATIEGYELSESAEPQQVCFDKLLDETVDTLPHTFSKAELKTFVSEFRRVCLGS